MTHMAADGELLTDEEQDKSLLDTAVQKTQDQLVVHDNGPNKNLFDTALFNQCLRVAGYMAQMAILPEHMKFIGPKNNRRELSFEEVRANCFRVVNQSIRWEMDPYAVVDETYVVGGKLGYQGKLVAAVVNARSGIQGRLSYEFSGTGDNLTVTVSGDLDGDVRTIDMRLGDAKTLNEMWKKDPEQKLCYSGATKWARRHCPEVILGVNTVDDLEQIAAQSKEKKRVTASTLADELPEPGNIAGNPQPENPYVPPPQEDLKLAPEQALDEITELFDACDKLGDLDATAKFWSEKYPGSAPLFKQWQEKRAADIRANRGENSNQQTLIDKGAPDAGEA